MPDPVIRRCEASATVYWEPSPAGPAVSRLCVDVPLPDLEGYSQTAAIHDDLTAAARQLVDRIEAHGALGRIPDSVLRGSAVVRVLLAELGR